LFLMEFNSFYCMKKSGNIKYARKRKKTYSSKRKKAENHKIEF
jgi:hypothetical protein